MKNEECKSLFICGHCGKEDKENIKKIICGEYANTLCFSCRLEFEKLMRNLARGYLDK